MIDIKTQYAGLTLRQVPERLFSNLFLKNKLKCKAIRLCRIQTIRKLPIISVVM